MVYLKLWFIILEAKYSIVFDLSSNNILFTTKHKGF